MKKCLLGSLIILTSFMPISAIAVEGAPAQKIDNLRVEGTFGFVGFSETFPIGSECSGNRVWIDLKDDIGKIQYSTALAAFAAQNTVSLRANPSAPKTFGACKIYDIYVVK